MGLGLSISLILINMIGPEQKVIVNSEPQKGSKISFDIYQNVQEVSDCPQSLSVDVRRLTIEMGHENLMFQNNLKSYKLQESIKFSN